MQPPYLKPHETGESVGSKDPASGYYHYENRTNSALRLRTRLALLWRGRWIILAVLVATVGGAAAYLYTRAPEYEAYSLLLVNTKPSAVTQGLSTDLGEALGLGDRTLTNEMLILRQSLAIADRVAGRLIETGVVPGTEQPLTILVGEDGTPLERASVTARLGGYVHIHPEGRDVDGIRVVATSTVPGEAALIANFYAEEYIARAQEASRARIFASRQFLEEQEAKLKGSLQALEDQIKTYMSEEGAAALDEETTHLVGQIAQLEGMRDEARVELSMKQATLERLQNEMEELEPRLVERAASGAEEELQIVQGEIAATELLIEQSYIRNPELKERPELSPDFQELVTRRDALKQRARVLSQQYVREVLSAGGIDVGSEGGGLGFLAQRRQHLAETQVAVTGLTAKLEVLDRRLGEYEADMRAIPAQAIELAQLQRARESSERLYMFLVEKLQEARIAEESEIGYAEIIRPATTPGVPVRPNTRRGLTLSVLLGLSLGVGLVLLRERFDTRLHHPGELREQGRTVLGVIPDMTPVIKSDFKGQETVTHEGRTYSTRLAMVLHPMSQTAEAYRRLRANIQFSRPDVVVQTLLVTSPDAGEGKTTTSLNLALAMTQAQRRTVIVDADLRNPRVHRGLGLQREPGLSQLLFEGLAFEPEAFATDFDNLYVIPAGRGVPNPSEALGSRKMRELIAVLRDAFDVVIFDTPPVLAFSDAMLLSTQCDGTIVVGEANQTHLPSIEQAVEILKGVGATIIGVVVNQYDERDGYGYGYQYGYRYGYAYRYGYRDPEQPEEATAGKLRSWRHRKGR